MLKNLIKECLDNAKNNGYSHDLRTENVDAIAEEMLGHALFEDHEIEKVKVILKELSCD